MPRGSGGGGGGEEDSGGGDKPQTPASEPAQPPPASPQKKKRKVSRSHSIPTHVPTPNVTMGGMEYGGPFGHRGNGMVPGHPSPFEGDPHGHPQWPHPHGHSHMHPLSGHSPMTNNPALMQQHMPMSPGVPPGAGYPGHPGPPGHPGYMRPPMGHPQHMPPTSMAMQGMGMPPSGPVEPVSSNGPSPINHNGMPPTSCAYNPVSSGQVYPKNQPRIMNQNNPNAPPIYPCGSCHKEVHDSDQAILCESGCNFWFHRQCTGLTQNAYDFLTKEVYAEWICDPCTNKKNTPLIKLKP